MHAVWIIILVFGLIGARTNGADSNVSPLQQIANDFRILSRVTNAIYLQTTTIKPDVDFQKILAELLHIDSKHFSAIVNVDVESTVQEVTRMRDEIKRLRDDKILPLKKDVKKRSLEDEIVHLEFLENIANKTEEMTEVLKIDPDILHKEADSIKDSNLMNHSCSKLDYKNIFAFVDIFEMEEKVLENDDMVETFNKFSKNESSKIYGCIKELIDLERDITSLPIWEAFKKHEMMMDAEKLTSLFWSMSKRLRNLITVRFYAISDVLEKTKSVWERANQTKFLDSFNRLNKSSRYATDKQFHLEHIPRVHTAGFRDSGDLMKVLDDLNSTWFEEKIASHGNTTGLVTALKPFQKVFEHILGLEKSWKRLITFATEHKDKISEASENMMSISELAASDFKSLLESSRNKLGTCASLAKTVKLDTFANFEKEQYSALNVYRIIKRVKKLISKLEAWFYRANYDGRNYLKLIKSVLDHLPARLKSTTPQDVLARRLLVSEFLWQHDKDGFVLKIMSHVANLAEDLELLKKASENVEMKQTITLKNLLEDTGYTLTTKCLRDDKFEALKVVDTVLGLINIDEFPSEDIGLVKTYLDMLLEIQSKLEKTFETLRQAHKSNKSSPILPLPTPQKITENIGICTKVLEDLEWARQNREILLNVTEFPEKVSDAITKTKLFEWTDPSKKLTPMFEKADKMDEMAEELLNGSIVDMTKIFDEAANINGIAGSREQLYHLEERVNKVPGALESLKYFRKVQDFDLDFSSYQSHLKNARLTVTSLNSYFDDIFGHNKRPPIQKESTVIWIPIVFGCIGSVLLILIIILLAYGLTESGKTKYGNIWMYYFGKREDFEKRWKYSLFMDTSNGKNIVLDAVREGNKVNLLKAVKGGAYINAYNKFGNTALHVATKLGQSELVEVLIRYGADRTLLNYENRTPEQMAPSKFRENAEEKVADYEKIPVIYKKYKNKKFRKSVPQKFPESSFHIYLDDNTDVTVSNQFLAKFSAITSDDMATSTHYVTKTDPDGVLSTDNVEILQYVFNGIIIMKESWLAACVVDRSQILRDSKYQVETIKYRGMLYQSVLYWSEAMAKSTMPYLHGAYVAVVMNEYDNLAALTAIVDAQGGIMLSEFPMKKFFNKDSHPYLHANLGPLFLIHDGTSDLTHYKNDSDNMYTLFTEAEFMTFLLRREIHRDKREHPIPALKENK